MTSWRTPLAEKPLLWVGSAKRDLLAFPEAVVSDFGYALGAVQRGIHPPSAKPWRGEGSGVLELREQTASGAFRAVVTVQFERAVYVLHCFQKKSPSGIRTSRTDVELVRRRLAAARADYEERYGQA
jgi:phage-related protein